MTGISEILVLVLLIACILILPRLFKGEPVKKTSSSKQRKKLSAKIRFGIVLTLVYPIVLALYIKPWNENIISFISFGIIPVFLVWAIAWIIAGRKK
ncbi:MAG: hypothetical protein K8S13_19710 [Desulfobacula sp.]|uniref:hypothetical protein n=1 Tax=Desulfobacula sp. TaxID=2593537 RepID=UPI0025C2220D|nr:hypothetical protein [Desulfobacula sp.]MCD4722065.1 hypothetical protein [Desulfobacula sp.]